MRTAKITIIFFLFLAGGLGLGLHGQIQATGNEAARPGMKTAAMNAQGTVVEISGALIRIERRIKESSEIMEFECGAPPAGLTVGDTVKIVYTEEKGKLLAVRIVRVAKESRRTEKQ